MLRVYLRRLVFSPITVVSSLVLVAALLISCLPLGNFTIFWGPLYLFQYMTAVGIVYYFVPIMTALPVCFVQYEIVAKNSDLYLVYRSNPKRYILSGVAASGISGAVITLSTFVIFFVFCVSLDGIAMILPQYQDLAKDIVYSEIFANRLHDFAGSCFANSPLWVLYLREGFEFACNGIIWPVISYTVLAFSKNQYIAAAAPFIFRTGFSYILQSIPGPDWLWRLNPTSIKLAGGTGDFDSGLLFVLTYIAVVLLICTILTFYRLRRRMNYG